MYRIKSKLSIEEFYELKKYHDSKTFIDQIPIVHNGLGMNFGLEYRFAGINYYVPQSKHCVYEFLNEKQYSVYIRKLKLEKIKNIEPNYGKLDE